jgi:hypothetical protein
VLLGLIVSIALARGSALKALAMIALGSSSVPGLVRLRAFGVRDDEKAMGEARLGLSK